MEPLAKNNNANLCLVHGPTLSTPPMRVEYDLDNGFVQVLAYPVTIARYVADRRAHDRRRMANWRNWYSRWGVTRLT